MLIQVSQVTRRPRGGVSLKPTTLTADTVRFGRGTANEVLLSDVRVAVAEAVIQARDGVFYLSQLGTNPVRLNGEPVSAAAVKPGDELLIGPYKIQVVEAADGVDIALTVELVSPLGDDFARLQVDSRIGLGRTRLDKRRIAWVASITIFLAFLVLPVIAHFVNDKFDARAKTEPARIIPAAFEQSWSVGEISNPHKNFAKECASCHEAAFTAVRDEACLTCHTAVQHHVDVKRFPNLVINNTPCGGCHQEHRGAHGTILQTQRLCTDCHADLKRTADNAQARNVSDFGTNHPEFRVSVVVDAAAKTFARVGIDPQARAVDHPNLKFSHKAHLDPLAWPREMRKLECASCHAPSPGGGYLMQPIAFTKHCAECHDSSLKFDPTALDRAVPHGDAKLAQRALQDFYARTALEGGVTDPTAPVSARRRPGTVLSEPERLEALAWARQRATEARTFVFDDFRGCGTCHEVDRSGAEFAIAPVLLQSQFLPQAQFNHAKHITVTCEGCHIARESVTSADVLIPGIESCRRCHGGESAGAKVRTTCIQCHDFHKAGIGPLHANGRAGPTAAAAEKK